jgi:hypothetical protein
MKMQPGIQACHFGATDTSTNESRALTDPPGRWSVLRELNPA